MPNSQEEEQPRFYVPLEVGGPDLRESDCDLKSEEEAAVELPEEQAERERDRFKGLLQLP